MSALPPKLPSEPTVTAVCVTYAPQLKRLEALLIATKPQVLRVILVDNSEAADDQAAVRQMAVSLGAELLQTGFNEGLAAGLNAGIERALAIDSCTYVLLLDEDSLPAPDMVAQLLKAFTDNASLAAAGPNYVDPRAGRPTTFPRFRRFPPRRALPAQESEIFDVDMLISSGSLISRTALQRIGAMDAGLFIDHVDTDWCLRAKSAGLTLKVVKAAAMEHALGERWVRLGPLRSLPVHNAERLYYVFRNSLLLYRRHHGTWPWIVSDLRRLAVVLLLGVTASGRPGEALTQAIAGTCDALAGRTGARRG